MLRENNLIQNISWYCWHLIPQSNFYIHCHLEILGLTKTALLIVKFSGCRYLFGHISLVKSVAWPDSQASQSNHLSDAFFNVLARRSIVTILNKSKNIVFHVNFPSLPCMCLWLSSGFNLYLFQRVITFQAAVFPLAYASSIVLDNSFRKHSATIFQYIFFSNLNMVIRSSNSCFCLYTEEPCLATTPFIRPPLASAHLP